MDKSSIAVGLLMSALIAVLCAPLVPAPASLQSPLILHTLGERISTTQTKAAVHRTNKHAARQLDERQARTAISMLLALGLSGSATSP